MTQPTGRKRQQRHYREGADSGFAMARFSLNWSLAPVDIDQRPIMKEH
jgi:hypothetical protein